MHVSKAQFRANALALMRRVETTGIPIVVTHRGKPTVEIRPYRARNPLDVLRGSVLRYDLPTEPVGDDDWEVNSGA